MRHVTTQIGLKLAHAGDQQDLRPGEYHSLWERDPHPQPGRVRALLRDRDEVRRLHAVLHGQAVRVGTEQVLVEIQNDTIDSLRASGNGSGARA